MNDEERDAIAQFASNQIQRNLQENEDLANLLTVLGKSIMEAKAIEKPTLAEIEGLKSSEQSGSKGTYRLITKAENNNPVFAKLQSYIKEKGGFATIHGLKIWLFSSDPDNKIGLRKK